MAAGDPPLPGADRRAALGRSAAASTADDRARGGAPARSVRQDRRPARLTVRPAVRPGVRPAGSAAAGEAPTAAQPDRQERGGQTGQAPEDGGGRAAWRRLGDRPGGDRHGRGGGRRRRCGRRPGRRRRRRAGGGRRRCRPGDHGELAHHRREVPAGDRIEVRSRGNTRRSGRSRIHPQADPHGRRPGGADVAAVVTQGGKQPPRDRGPGAETGGDPRWEGEQRAGRQPRAGHAEGESVPQRPAPRRARPPSRRPPGARRAEKRCPGMP